MTHISAPLLQERETYLAKKRADGNGLRSLQMTADHLLFAVTHLSITDTSLVGVSEIVALQSEWTGPKCNFFVSTVINWLDWIGRLDSRYKDPSLLFNQFSTVCHYRLRYLTAPLYAERLSYLLYLESQGMAYSRLHEYGWMQLQIIDKLQLTERSRISERDIASAIQERISADSKSGHATSPKWIKTFKAVAYGWLSYLKILQDEQKQVYPAGYDFAVQYITWAIESKGLADTTLCGRERELRCFMSFLEAKGYALQNLSLEQVDKYTEYRHNSGSGRRSIATIVTTLRDFLRYMTSCGICHITPGAIRSPRMFSMETLPVAPSWDDVERLVGYYGIDDARGRRNTAIMALMAIYGMRSSEVAGLRMCDIDWEKETIYLRRAKRGGLQAIPLGKMVAGLISDYILHGRNNTIGGSHLFLSLQMPYAAITRGIVYNIVANAYKALDIKIQHKGGHSLRHACASHLINNGKTLKDASDLLGHRMFDTTRIYAKTDMNSLRNVANIKWEGLL